VNERWIEPVLGKLLRVGVLTAALIVTVGAVIFLWQDGTSAPHYQIFRGEPGELRSVPGILHRAISFDSRGIIMLGLLALIATPVARVVVSIGAFLVDCDLFYVGVTVLVLSILIYSLLGTHP
jgi:uncharacterized membrane protein